MKTVIISAFPGCGKTYLAENQKNLDYTIADIDSYKFAHEVQWVCKYIDYVLSNIGKYDFILITQQDEVLMELKKRDITFVTVAPDNSLSLSVKERQLIKQQWFGRFILRNNSHITNLNLWLEKLEKNYDNWTNPDFFEYYKPLYHFALKQDEYLEDIIGIIGKLAQSDSMKIL